MNYLKRMAACAAAALIMTGMGSATVLAKEQDAELIDNSVAGWTYSSGDITLLDAKDAVYWYDVDTCLLNYLDESDMSWHILCGNPDCEHTVEENAQGGHTSDCDAFIERMFYTPLGYYNGRIYYVEGIPTLTDRWISSVKADGTDHKREIEIEYYQDASAQYYFNYGRLYVLNTLYEGDSFAEIYRLDTLEKTSVTLNGVVEQLRITDKYVHYAEFSADFSSKTEKRMNLDGGEAQEELGGTYTGTGAYYGADGMIIMNQEKGLIKVDYITGEENVLWNDCKSYGVDGYYLRSDGTYIYLRSYNGDDIFSQNESSSFLVLDMDGKLVRAMDIINQDEFVAELKEKIDSETDKEKKEEYQYFYGHVNSAEGANDAFYGSAGGYIFASGCGMPNQYIKIEDLASGAETVEWQDAGFVY